VAGPKDAAVSRDVDEAPLSGQVHLKILVNNAGMLRAGTIESFDLAV